MRVNGRLEMTVIGLLLFCGVIASSLVARAAQATELHGGGETFRLAGGQPWDSISTSMGKLHFYLASSDGVYFTKDVLSVRKIREDERLTMLRVVYALSLRIREDGETRYKDEPNIKLELNVAAKKDLPALFFSGLVFREDGAALPAINNAMCVFNTFGAGYAAGGNTPAEQLQLGRIRKARVS